MHVVYWIMIFMGILKIFANFGQSIFWRVLLTSAQVKISFSLSSFHNALLFWSRNVIAYLVSEHLFSHFLIAGL